MKLFTAEAAELRAWKKKLEVIPSNRRQLKSELIALLSNEELSIISRRRQFNQRRRELLHGSHHQGPYWTPSFNWFYTLLSALTRGRYVRKKSGSRLRRALSEDINVDSRLLSLNDYKSAAGPTILTDREYEEVLFEAPAMALSDIKTRLTSRDSDSGTLIKRVHALKYRLDSSTYEHLLSQLFQRYPAQSALYFYQAGKPDHYDTPADNDFIELNLLVHTLMQHFIRNTSHIHLHNHNIIYLLSLISITNTPALKEAMNYKADPFLQLLINWNESGKPNFSAYDELFETLQACIYSKLAPAEQLQRQGHQTMFRAGEKDISPFQILVDCWNVFTPKASPLLVHIARQSLEQLFSDYFLSTEDSTWIVRHSGHEAISFITRRLVNTPLRKDTKHFKKLLHEQWDAAMSTLGFVPVIPSSFRFAEHLSLTLINAINRGNFLGGARCIRTKNSAGTGLDESDLNWIMIRISRLDKSLLPALKHILYHTRVYSQPAFDELLSRQSAPVTMNLEDSIEAVRTHLNSAKEAARSLDSEHENTSVEFALVGISHCLEHKELSSESIERLVNECLPMLQNHYITDELHGELVNRFNQQQARLLSWDARNIVQMHPECVNEALIEAQSCLNSALAEKSSFFQRSFCKEREYSSRAVACFSHYMSNPSPATRSLARAVLNSMQPYLTPDCFRQWSQALSREIKPSIVSSGNAGLFHHKPTEPAANDVTPHAAVSIQN